MDQLHSIWLRESQRAVSSLESLTTNQTQVVNKLHRQPHIELVAFMKTNETEDGPVKEQSVWRVLQSLAAARDLISSEGPERSRLAVLWVQLNTAYQYYTKIMMQKCYSTEFIHQEYMFTGWTQRYFRNLTFSQALSDKYFARYVQRALDPRLYIIRATGRLLNGMSTQPLTQAEAQLIQRESESVSSGGSGDNNNSSSSSSSSTTPPSQSNALTTALANCQSANDVTQKLKSLTTDINTIWKSHTTALQQLRTCDAYACLTPNDVDLLKTNQDQLHHLLTALKTTSISTIEPDTPLRTQVWTASHAMLSEWKGFLSFAPNGKEISKRAAEQCSKMSEAVTEIVQQYATVDAWLQQWVQSSLQPAMIKVTSRAHAPVTYQTVQHAISLLHTSLNELQPALASMGISIEHVASAGSRAQSMPIPLLTDELDTDKVHTAWRKALKDAVVLDSCSYMLQTIAHIKDEKSDKASAFIKEQLARDGLIDGMYTASTALQRIVEDTAKQASAHLCSFFHAPLVQPLQTVLGQLVSFRATIEKETHDRKQALRRATIDAVKAAVNKCQTKLQCIPDTAVVQYNTDATATELAQVWANINNTSNDARYASCTDILFELRNALQTRQQLIAETNAFNNVKKLTTMLCVTFAAQSLVDNLTQL